jgi:hypothetical protein
MRQSEQESVWNVVWRRRVIYFLTVFASLYVVIYPLVRESYAYQEMATRLRIVADTINLFGAFLPSGAARWLHGYARDSAWFLLWAGVIAFLIWYASTLKSEINSRMRRIWDAHLSSGLQSLSHAQSSVKWTTTWSVFIASLAYVAIYPVFDELSFFKFLKLPDSWNSLIDMYSQQPIRFAFACFLIAHFIPEPTIQWLRTRTLYTRSLFYLKNTLAPLGFAILILYGAFGIGNHLLFNIRDSFGSFCKHNTNDKGPLNAENPGFDCQNGKCSKAIEFDSSLTDGKSLCLATGTFAERGERYAIDIYRDQQKWEFWNESSAMSGQPIWRAKWWKQPLLAMMFPLRRVLDRPWSLFIVRYGYTGTEESFLDPKAPALEDNLNTRGYNSEGVPENDEQLGEEWRASRDGEIYLYLNKPVLGIWGMETWISKYIIPTKGTAHITIQKK